MTRSLAGVYTPWHTWVMSATQNERLEVQARREAWDRRLTTRGHKVVWRLAPNATREGYVYFVEGRCRHCDGYIQLAPGYTREEGWR